MAIQASLPLLACALDLTFARRSPCYCYLGRHHALRTLSRPPRVGLVTSKRAETEPTVDTAIKVPDGPGSSLASLYCFRARRLELVQRVLEASLNLRLQQSRSYGTSYAVRRAQSIK
jgi:hypothetical protein